MSDRTGGQRPRPRVALLGIFEADDMIRFEYMFPTVWQAENIWRLKEKVDVREIDLIVIAPDIAEALDWPDKKHVICFSSDMDSLPGPIPGSKLRIFDEAETEEFLFPDARLPVSRRRQADYGDLSSVRGWPRIVLRFRGDPRIPKTKQRTATSIFSSGSIICERHTNSPLAVAFIREESNLGVGWLPNVTGNRAEWVELLVTQWAQSDKEAFPCFGDWTKSPEWLVVEEEQILSQIWALERKKEQYIVEIDQQIGELSSKLALAKADANAGQRRLITAQGEELVDEVAKTMKNIGFDVTRIDQLLGEKEPKREDLRLNHLDKEHKEWSAIVEIRGYARSGGTTTDLQRLARFAELYRKETGQTPDKRIYIVNGQLELPPSQRQEPLASAAEDLQIFSESDGILIWSIDLFRALKTTNTADYPALIESIKCARDRWIPADLLSLKET